jgi:hypothetical protein
MFSSLFQSIAKVPADTSQQFQIVSANNVRAFAVTIQGKDGKRPV